MIGYAVFLALILVPLAFWLWAELTAKPGQTLRMILAWVAIFAAVIGVVGIWPLLRETIAPQQVSQGNRVEIPVSRDGHFHLRAMVNDVAVQFVVDTGASNIALGQEDARRIGLDPKGLAYTGRANTANGVTATASVRLDSITIGDIRDEGVYASVVEGMDQGSLMGMDYLSRFARVTLTPQRLILER